MCNVCAMNERDSGAGSFGFPSVPLHVQRRYYFQCSFKSLSPPASFLGRDIFGREPRLSDLFSSMDRHSVQTNLQIDRYDWQTVPRKKTETKKTRQSSFSDSSDNGKSMVIDGGFVEMVTPTTALVVALVVPHDRHIQNKNSSIVVNHYNVR